MVYSNYSIFLLIKERGHGGGKLYINSIIFLLIKERGFPYDAYYLFLLLIKERGFPYDAYFPLTIASLLNS